MLLNTWERDWLEQGHRDNVELALGGLRQESARTREALERAANQIAQTNMQAAARVAGSLDGLAYHLDDVHSSIQGLRVDVDKGFSALGATFTWGVYEIARHLEEHRSILKDILETLRSPRTTEADELRDRYAKPEYLRGLTFPKNSDGRKRCMDDAYKDFGEAIAKHRYDFTVHLDMGIIALAERADARQGIEHFTDAVHYATGRSDDYAAQASFWLGKAHYELGDTTSASAALADCLRIRGDWQEARFEDARVSIAANRLDRAVEHIAWLTHAHAVGGSHNVSTVANWCVRIGAEVGSEGELGKIRDQVSELMQRHRITALESASRAEEELREWVSVAMALPSKLSAIAGTEVAPPADLLATLETNKERIKEAIKKNTYLDALNAIDQAEQAVTEAQRICDSITRAAQRMVEQRIDARTQLKQREVAELRRRRSALAERYRSEKLRQSFGDIVGITIVCGVIYGIIGAIVSTVIGFGPEAGFIGGCLVSILLVCGPVLSNHLECIRMTSEMSSLDDLANGAIIGDAELRDLEVKLQRLKAEVGKTGMSDAVIPAWTGVRHNI